ncbi:MAG TPA: hypothetical protein VGP70_11930 [Actinomadura sp.]|jgi:uncharacterized membrane protein YeaQ/YmgE (transglycosylase-associated protein family)|nr:hypothetical protein [Actinomadura sp.]
MISTILWYIVAGAIIGALARLVIPGRNPIGIVLTILVGIVGAIIGGVIARSLGAGNLVALLFAVIVAALGVALVTAAYRSGRVGARTHRRMR